MVILPKLRCPTCGRGMGPVKADVVPPADKYEDCLRKCDRCGVGATNAKNPAKVRYLQSDQPRPHKNKDAQTQDAAPLDSQPQDTPPQDATPPDEQPKE